MFAGIINFLPTIGRPIKQTLDLIKVCVVSDVLDETSSFFEPIHRHGKLIIVLQDGQDFPIGKEFTSHGERLQRSAAVDIDFDVRFLVHRIRVLVGRAGQ